MRVLKDGRKAESVGIVQLGSILEGLWKRGLIRCTHGAGASVGAAMIAELDILVTTRKHEKMVSAMVHLEASRAGGGNSDRF